LFRLTEKANFQIRAEFTNPFNRTQIPDPIGGFAIGAGNYSTAITTIRGTNGFAVNNAGFGAIATQPANAVIGERSGLLVGRITF
jgi:hypothetical protein